MRAAQAARRRQQGLPLQAVADRRRRDHHPGRGAGAFCQAKAISAACEGISPQPGGAPHIRFLLLLGLILIETLVIYALLVTFIILMVKWGQYA